MAPTTRSQKLGQAHYTAAANNTIYTAPAATVTLVKFTSVFNNTGSVATAQFFVVDATSGGFAMTDVFPTVAAFSSAGGLTWYVLEPGDQLHIFCSATDWTAYAAGAELPQA